MGNFRKLLFPFSLCYGGIMLLRNQLYDLGILHSRKFPLPVIAVGNLSTGGTGKSPMVEFLIDHLRTRKRVAVLSRGYNRNTRGFFLLMGKESATQVGDEPLQFKTRFPEITVAVDEDRAHGLEKLLEIGAAPEVVVLDDAFQHRRIRADMYMLLTQYNRLFPEDMVLPAGNLREPAVGSKRADIIVVTKCPPDLGEAEQESISRKIRARDEQKIFFTSIEYSNELHGVKRFPLESLLGKKFSVLTGIADPEPLLSHLKSRGLSFNHLRFGDHHNFTATEISQLREKGLILTTQKDYMRLQGLLQEKDLFYLPIRMRLLAKEEEFFTLVDRISIQEFKKNETVEGSHFIG